MTKGSSKVVIVMPAYNAEKTLVESYNEIPSSLKKFVILVDDQSKDKTLKVAKKLKLKSFNHLHNLGYGGNQITCYLEALKLNPCVVSMLHPDHQYDGKFLTELIKPIVDGKLDFVYGSRFKTKNSAIDGGMPKYKYLINRLFCSIHNVLLQKNYTEYFSGFRAYSADVLKTVPFQRFSHDFLFDEQMTLSVLSYGFRIGEISIPTKYDEKSSSMKLSHGLKFIPATVWLLFLFELHKFHILQNNLFAPWDKKSLSKHE